MIDEKKEKMRKRIYIYIRIDETRRVNEARAIISHPREYSSGKI